VPKAEPPRTKPELISLPDSFRRTGRRLTRRLVRRRIRAQIGGAVFYYPQKFQASGRAANEAFRLETPSARDAASPDRYITGSAEHSPSLPQENDHARSSGAEDRTPGDVPDVSAEFRSEFAALLAFYAARIGAARRSLSRSVADAIVMAIVNEQAVALRALTDRWHAASQKQRDEKPERPTGNVQRNADDLKPS
jgi:hypothetical protein